MKTLEETFGPVIFSYTRAQAIELGVLGSLLDYLQNQQGQWGDVFDSADNLRAAIRKATGKE